ncbi:MAG: hypothetical protein Ta2B_25060 [Termitinemataceae bacterium]|nr:MAG: hypothetical protein Ta2B_25060 [Termitinemataceae bacterium]
MQQIALMNPTTPLNGHTAAQSGSNSLLQGFAPRLDAHSAFISQQGANQFADYLAKLSSSLPLSSENSASYSHNIYDPQDYHNDMQGMIALAKPDGSAGTVDRDIASKAADGAKVTEDRAADEKAEDEVAAEKAAGEDALYADISKFTQNGKVQGGAEAEGESGIAEDGSLMQGGLSQAKEDEAALKAAKNGSSATGEADGASAEAVKRGTQASVKQNPNGGGQGGTHSAGQKNTGEITDGVFYDKHGPADDGEAAKNGKYAVKFEGDEQMFKAGAQGNDKKLNVKSAVAGTLGLLAGAAGEAAKSAGEKKGSGLQNKDAKKILHGETDDRLSSAKRAKKKSEADSLSVRTETASLNPAQSKEVTKITSAGGKETEITVHLRSEPKNYSAAISVTGQGAGAPAQSLDSLLARELHQNLNGDIVRQASVILGEGGTGTVKLSLKPESLGQVKIHLQMADNKVTGNIVVESEDALKAFRQELASLEAAFKEGGFDGANLNLQLANGEARGRGDEAKEMQQQFALETGAGRYESTSATVSNGAAATLYSEHSGTSLNVLV